MGIYKLNFSGTDKVYVGQSVRIERRFTEHLNKLKQGIGYPKLQDAYQEFGQPTLEIILECRQEELNALENEAIEIYCAVSNGFNTLDTAGNPNLKGADSPNAKYAKQVYIDILQDLYLNTTKSLKEVASSNNVTIDVVQKIAAGTSHIWLKEEYPEQHARIISNHGKRYGKNRDIRLIVSPEGEIFEVDCSIREFARRHDIGHAHISCILNGSRKSYLGWTKYNNTEI